MRLAIFMSSSEHFELDGQPVCQFDTRRLAVWLVTKETNCPDSLAEGCGGLERSWLLFPVHDRFI